ncbi:MAG: DUF4276 family protein [Methylophilus sp.]|uniref:DUF4276 family protein n=1 Tax=Methylophilus sp. TaxID=29541 RepID=UPI003F9F56C4
MSRLLIHVEGETEETFVNEVLAPHLYNYGYTNIGARLLGNARMRAKRGGIKSWSSVRDEIINHLKADTACFSTIMVDYYALPQKDPLNWPMRAASSTLAFERKPIVIQDAIHADICMQMGGGFKVSRFIPYIMMHEFEGLLFSDPEKLAYGIGKASLSESFSTIKGTFPTPEHINDSPLTAPSKRILDLYPSYNKPLMGTLAALEIGLTAIRQECPLFNAWLTQLESGCV